MSQTGLIHTALAGTSPRGLIGYTAPGGNRDSAIKQLACSVDVAIDNAGSSRLPRMAIRWGHGAAQQSLVADLASCRFSVIGSSLSIDVFEEPDDPASWAPGAIVKASAVVTNGYCESSLTYTTPTWLFNAVGPGGLVPKYARTISAITGATSPPFAEGCPMNSYVYFYRITSAPTEAFDMTTLIHKPKLISPYGGLQSWYVTCGDAASTAKFRLLFQLGI